MDLSQADKKNQRDRRKIRLMKLDWIGRGAD